MQIAFIGLGVMGYPMAGHLQRGGFDVTVYNRTSEKADRWVKEYGGSTAPTPAAASEGAEIILSCVGNDEDVRSVILGDEGVFAGAGEGAILVDHTTASAGLARDSRTARPGSAAGRSS